MSTLYKNASGANAVATLTQAALATGAWNLQSLKITVNGQPAWLTSPNCIIYDGSAATGDVLAQFDLPLSGSAGVIYDIVMPPVSFSNQYGGYVGTPGRAMTIVVSAAGAGKTVQVNAAFGSP